jgi:hypothetical protein
MKLKILFFMLLLISPCIASAKIIGNFSDLPTKTVSLAEAKAATLTNTSTLQTNTPVTNVSESNDLSIDSPSTESTSVAMSDGQQMISGGITEFITSMADSFLYSGYGIQTQNETTGNLSSSQALVFSVAGYQLDPYAAPPVQKILKQTYGLFYTVALIIILAAYSWFLVQRYFPGFASDIVESVTGSEKYFDFNSFLHVWIILIGWSVVSISAVKFVLSINDVIVSGMLTDIIGQIGLSSQNLPLYLVMTIGYFILSLWVFMRIVFVYIIAAYVLVLGLLFAWPFTRPLAKVIMLFFVGIVAMQPIMIATISFCVEIVNYAGSWLQPLSIGVYAGGILILEGVCFVIIFWPIIYVLFKMGVAQKAIGYIGV